jgi:Zn finger protein HypA/HybF involved in hydrogenase expression
MKKCNKCQNIKSLEEFGNNKLKKDGKQLYCKKCHAEFDRNNYLKNPNLHKIRKKNNEDRIKEWFRDYKQTLRCKKCNDGRWYILQFHHLDSESKEHNISNMTRYSINRIKNELNKCISLCANCHFEFHYLEHKSNITIENYLKNN